MEQSKHLLKSGRMMQTGIKLLSTRANPDSNTMLKDPVRQVFISQSNDVFTNLALEDWLYKNHDFDHKHLLLLWRNDPCVVIGRHQNPWTESNVPFLREKCINLARRNSGGGTVYHDLGNLNCTFFTRRSRYDRKRNLNIICNAIREATALNVAVNDREDIILDEKHKISGTAAKLGKNSAYHHCTVLVDVNECVLHDALSSKAEGIESRATQSVRVPVKNLAMVSPNLNVSLLQEAVGWQFLRTNVLGEDEGFEAASNQRGFQMIRPDNDWFPGLDQLRQDFYSHQWIFGKTPKFKVSKTFEVPNEVIQSNSKSHLIFDIEVMNGIVQDVSVQMSPDFLDPDLIDLSEILLKLDFNDGLAKKFSDLLSVHSANISEVKRNFLLQCLDEMIGKFV
jgi:lipoyltransferase 1